MSEKRQMLIEVATGEAHPASPDRPVLSSARGPWPGVLLEQHSGGRLIELRDVAPPEHLVIVKLQGPSVVEWGEGSALRSVNFLPGQALLIPAMFRFSYRTPRSGEIVALTLESKFLRCAAHDMFAGPDRLELEPVMPINDPLLQALGLSLKAEAEAGYPGGQTYGESLATALAVHLVRHYSNARPAPRSERGGLARAQLQRALDFMHDHLAEEVSLAAIAAQARLSPFHFARLFKQDTGLSPHQYLLQRRVERARDLLLSTPNTTADIAVQAGFCDQSHLTVHFRRVFGVTPREFRRQQRAPQPTELSVPAPGPD